MMDINLTSIYLLDLYKSNKEIEGQPL